MQICIITEEFEIVYGPLKSLPVVMSFYDTRSLLKAFGFCEVMKLMVHANGPQIGIQSDQPLMKSIPYSYGI